jgi:hypothetical protein
LKVISNLLPSKLTEPFSGMLSTTTGGTLSLGPPVGELTFAQLPVRAKNAAYTKKLDKFLLFINSSGYF